MSKVFAVQVRADWAETTFRYDSDETFKELYAILRRTVTPIADDDHKASMLAGEIALRAVVLFAEKLPTQLDAMMGKMLTDAASAAIGQFISDLTARGLSTREARTYQAKLRGMNNVTDAFINKQVWGKPPDGRTPDITLATILRALKECGEDATQKTVAAFLSVHVDSLRVFQRNQGFKGKNAWRLLKQRALQTV